MVTLRTEAPGDEAAIRAILEAAFPTAEEADLVDELRRCGLIAVSLVAVREDQIVGHVLFSPVTLDGQTVAGLGLAPLAVLPAFQKQGIGSLLATEGLRRCRAAGAGFVVVLGDREYYRPFGFVPAQQYRLSDEYGATDHFQAVVWEPLALPPAGGLVRYSPPFGRFAA